MGLGTPASSVETAVQALATPKRRGARERVFAVVLLSATVVSVLVLGVLIADVLMDGLGRINGEFFTSYASRRAERTGIRAGLTGSLSLLVMVAAMAFPLGVAAALYLEEFAPDNRLTRVLEANIANLAGVPSVVYGLLGAAVFVYLFEFGRSLLTGAFTLALLILPVVIVASREALRAVPRAIRDGGLALGATPLQVAWRQTVPSALPGILTGTILALSRAVGETAPILVAGAVLFRRSDNVPWGFFDAFTALPIQIYDFVSRPQEAFRVEAAAAAIIVLLAVLLVMNSAAIVLRNRYARRW
ncbi:MAG TPA: phosphate ABC transporter permease PstA [Egibacteraceae bacterium]|nr:phosphate ABC transporter permease PstA [Egibacteraceae bacterium]